MIVKEISHVDHIQVNQLEVYTLHYYYFPQLIPHVFYLFRTACIMSVQRSTFPKDEYCTIPVVNGNNKLTTDGVMK